MYVILFNYYVNKKIKMIGQKIDKHNLTVPGIHSFYFINNHEVVSVQTIPLLPLTPLDLRGRKPR